MSDALSSLRLAAQAHLRALCAAWPCRAVGSPGNALATDYVYDALAARGWEPRRQTFTCLDWSGGPGELRVVGETYAVQASPYALGCQVEAELVVCSALDHLEAVDTVGKVLLLTGALATEPLMPKAFPFYNPEGHRHLVSLLEAKGPAAVIAATGTHPETAGAITPFPLIEDGDLTVPAAHMSDVEGARLASHAGERVHLRTYGRRRPSTASNIVAGLGAPDPKIVVCAHVDAKMGTPGAVDNAAGVTVLLLLADLLSEYDGAPGIELLAVNGEDYYSAAGEVTYLGALGDAIDEVGLAINIDAAGYVEGPTAYSLYGCEEPLASHVREVMSPRRGFVEGEPWYQSDHMVFVQHGRPAVAITSSAFVELSATVTHTPADVPDLVDPFKLVATAEAIGQLLTALSARQ